MLDAGELVRLCYPHSYPRNGLAVDLLQLLIARCIVNADGEVVQLVVAILAVLCHACAGLAVGKSRDSGASSAWHSSIAHGSLSSNAAKSNAKSKSSRPVNKGKKAHREHSD